MVNGAQKIVAVLARHQAGQRLIAVVEKPHHRRRWRDPANRKMRHRRQAVQVGPGALVHAGDVSELLDGRIARFHDHRQRLRHVADHPARCTKVQQQGPAGRGQQHDVVGRQIAVVPLLGMDHRQRVGHRPQPAQDGGLVGRAVQGLQVVAQRGALVERHHHVGRAIGLPEPVHLDQRRVVKLGQHLGLVDKAAQPGDEGLGLALRAHADLGPLAAHGDHRRHVLFDGHLPVQRVVPGPVDDAETAFAHNAQQLEFTQPGAHHQRIARAAMRQ